MRVADSIALELINICHSYKHEGRSLQILSRISLKVKRGQVVCIMGASGSGKSTMLSIAGLLLKPDEGVIKIAGEYAGVRSNKTKLRAKNIGFVYQNQFLLEDLTAQENVELPLLIRGEDAKLARAKSLDMLKKMDLLKRAKHMPYQLCGGERQRVAVARAAIISPQLIIADEPTGSLNADQGREVFYIIKDLTKEGCGCLFATHDIHLAAMADEVYSVESGRLKEQSIHSI